MKTTVERIGPQLERALPAAWLIAGDEPLLVAEAADQVRAAARSQGYTQRELHIVERGFDWDALRTSSQNLSLFAERRIVELRLASARPGERGGAVLAGLAAEPDPDRLVLVTAPKLDAAAARARWIKAFESHGVFAQAWPVEATAMPGWIAARLRRQGLAADREAIELLASRCEGNLLAASQEIDKLALLVVAGQRIGVEEVLAWAGDSARFDVFRLADAALAGDARRALHVLAGLRREGVEPVLISWSLIKELRTLISLRAKLRSSSAIDRLLEAERIWPRRRPLFRKALLRLTPDRLAELQQLAARTDLAIKGQAHGQPWSLLGEFILGLTLADAPLPQAHDALPADA
ncbi:MAG: DNA polymerase III subunit delta [Gammaproteobacteria bacterium]|nr:DNA polymerase III subunit delta [Gammaproteobacteria bacterium]